MNYYLTYNDEFSGVYKGQVIDVVKMFNENNINLQLISFVSIKNYKQNKHNIKMHLTNAIVIPMIPKLKFFLLNKFILSILVNGRDNNIICRSIFATNIALSLKKKFKNVIYDGRGAIFAESKEYNVFKNTGMEDKIYELEKKAVLESDFRIAVSNTLKDYWIKQFGFNNKSYTIIPCTTSEDFLFTNKTYNNSSDIIICFTGSISGWQSFEKIYIIMKKILSKQENVKILFLTKENEFIKKLGEEFSNRIERKWVNIEEVKNYLVNCDYGILLREDNVTNNVASPVKFAEYLACGLKILISEKLGDYSEFVKEFDCGYIINSKDEIILAKVPVNKKVEISNLAKKYLIKSSPEVKNNYLNIIKY